MQLTGFWPEAAPGAAALFLADLAAEAVAPSRRNKSPKPAPSKPPIPSWIKSLRGIPAQFPEVGFISMVQHKFRGVEQRPKDILHRCIAGGSRSRKRTQSSLKLRFCGQAIEQEEVQFTDEVGLAPVAVS